MATKARLDSLDLPEGFILSNKFEIIGELGGGWEGEVYSIRELSTGIERAAKIFYPHRNIKNRSAKFYARKLHKLRNCKIIIQYQFQDQILYKGNDITYLISEYVEGMTLTDFLKNQKGRKLHPFQAIHLLHGLAKGMEEVHLQKEYHGDLHTGNIIIQRFGLSFELKILDLFHLGGGSQENIKYDVCNLIKIFYDSLGGQKSYSKQPKVVKDICCGLKSSLILKKYKTAGQLRNYLENLSWD